MQVVEAPAGAAAALPAAPSSEMLLLWRRCTACAATMMAALAAARGRSWKSAGWESAAATLAKDACWKGEMALVDWWAVEGL